MDGPLAAPKLLFPSGALRQELCETVVAGRLAVEG